MNKLILVITVFLLMIIVGSAKAEREIFCEKKAGYKLSGNHVVATDQFVGRNEDTSFWVYDDGKAIYVRNHEDQNMLGPDTQANMRIVVDNWMVCRHDEAECDMYVRTSMDPACQKGRIPKIIVFWEDQSVFYNDQMSSDEVMIDGRACTKLREPLVLTQPVMGQGGGVQVVSTQYCVNKEFCEDASYEIAREEEGVWKKERIEVKNLSRDFPDSEVMPPADCLNAVAPEYPPADGGGYGNGEDGSGNGNYGDNSDTSNASENPCSKRCREKRAECEPKGMDVSTDGTMCIERCTGDPEKCPYFRSCELYCYSV